MVEIMDDMRTPPGGFTGYTSPCHSFGTAPPVADMRLTDVISNRRAVRINLHATANIRHIEILLWVTESVRINDLNCGGIPSPAPPQPVRPVLEDHQRIPVNQLVAKGQAQHLRHSQLAFNIAVPPRVICPGAPVRLQRFAVLFSPC
ncbi:hypothetical protein KONIH1_12710 [Klebsiella oxytoca KONIH1]|nr:hypothetical protein KONIH1_12710 [Klebsiella oxytoca KONIH1]